MKRFLSIFFIVIGTLSPLFADSVGTFSFYLFHQGSALPDNEVRLDGSATYRTDTDGSLKVNLSQGEHLVEVFAKNKEGYNLGYSKKRILIKEGKNTQLIVSFANEKEPNILLETLYPSP